MVKGNGHESANLQIKHEVVQLWSLEKRQTATQALRIRVPTKGHYSIF